MRSKIEKTNLFFRIAVCDDETLDREQIERMTKEICDREQIHASIKGFCSAEELRKDIEQKEVFDLLLLDVLMPGLNGMELAEEIRRQNQTTDIVFISNNREMALRGYLVSAERYLAKPLTQDELTEAIQHCFQKTCDEAGVLVPYEKVKRRLLPGEVMYIEASNRRCLVIQKNEAWESSTTMTEMENMLCQRGFYRCHKGYLVNYRYIRTLGSKELVLEDGKKIPISKHRSKEVREWYFDMMNR